MSIYRRERLRQRLLAHVAAAGRSVVTDDDLATVRAQGMGRAVPDRLPSIAWPVLPGAYVVVDPHAPVAVCALASEWLVEPLAALPGVAIAGRALTENLGVEKVVLNVLANPAVHALVLCGTESRHAVGDTIRQLHRAGLDADGRVIGSSGPTPVLRNLPDVAVRTFQHEISLVELIDETDITVIGRALADAASAQKWPRAEGWLPPSSLRTPAPIVAEPWSEDPAGFVLISVGPWRDRLVAELYTREGVLRHVLQARTAEELAGAVVTYGGASTLDHAAYIGREASRAELALTFGWPYEQDRPFERPAPP